MYLGPSNSQVLRPPNTSGCLMEGSGLPLKAEARSLWVEKTRMGISLNLCALRKHPGGEEAKLRDPKSPTSIGWLCPLC